MTLRILGGSMRGRLLNHPNMNQSAQLPPSCVNLSSTSAKIHWRGKFPDLFAGSGSIGIEALSRGAEHVTFVDSDHRSIQCIQDNLRTLKLEDKATLLKGDVLAILNRLEEMKKTYDIIYIDPPYGETTLPSSTDQTARSDAPL